MDLTHALLVATVLACAIPIVISTSDTQRVALLLVLSLPQLYLLPFSGVYISAEVGLALLLLPVALERLHQYRPPAARLVVAYLVAEAISIGWSSDPRLAERTILYQVPFLVMFALAYASAKKNGRLPTSLLYLIASLGVLEAVAVIAFRVSPAIESSFLHSGAANIFVNPNSLATLFTILPDNVLDPAKAGGVFLNANVASAYLGVMAFVVAGAALTLRRPLLVSAAIFIWSSVFFTGSGLGTILAVGLPALLWAFGTNGHRRRGRVSVLAIALVAVGCLQATGYLHIAKDKSLSEGSRLLIWQFAGHEFMRTPIRGQGFGGWQQSFPSYAAGRDLLASFPPHNSLIYTWSQAGLLAAGCAVWALVRLTRALTRTHSASSAIGALAAGTAVALTWLVAQSFVENYGLFGDEHVQAPIAFAIALCLGTRNAVAPATSLVVEEGDGSVHHRDLPEPALSTI